jgi:hypothetical protein
MFSKCTMSVVLAAGLLAGVETDGANGEGAAATTQASAEQVLFLFEKQGVVNDWTSLDDPLAKVKEPGTTIGWGQVEGKGVMKVTFEGGEWPTVVTEKLPRVEWEKFNAMKVEVRVPRACVLHFRVYTDKSVRGYDKNNEFGSRWEKSNFLQSGRNVVVMPFELPKKYQGKPTSVEMAMFRPHKGELIEVEKISLATVEFPKPAAVKFAVLGTDLQVKDPTDLGVKLKDQWKKPQVRTLEEVEADFKVKFEELKKGHPRAVMAILRDGEAGWDAAHPEKVFGGWRDSFIWSHPPDGQAYRRAVNSGKAPATEAFERWRSRIMQVDLSVVPKGSEILAAQMVLIRAGIVAKERRPSEVPNMWVAEACNRAWDEYEVNAYQYAKDKFWKALAGRNWEGADPDFLPLYVAYGPSQGTVNVWDFTQAVKYWTDGKHENHGFFWHSDHNDFWYPSPMREAQKVKDRPAMMVVWVPTTAK